MRHAIRTVAVVGASIATLAATATGAHALSLGPAGTTVSGQGKLGIGSPNSLYYGYTFDGIAVDCASLAVSGQLDGGASVRLATTYATCTASENYSGPGGASGPATVAAPGGHRLTLTQVSRGSDGVLYGRGTLSSGTGGVTVTVGSCTLTIPRDTSLIGPGGQVQIYDGTHVAAVQPLLRYPTLPYTGSAGCPATQRGTHTRGAGLSYWFTQLKGTKLAA